MQALPVVAVLCDTAGAADPREIVAAARDTAQVVFVYHASPGTRAAAGVLNGLAPTITLDDPRTADRLREGGVSGIVTFSDALVTASGDLAARLGLRHNRPATCRRLNDKYAQRLALSEAGLRHVSFARVGGPDGVDNLDKAIKAVGLPAVLKPTHGRGSRATYLLGDQADVPTAEAVVRNTRESFILESYLPGEPGFAIADYISVETLACDGDYQHYGVSGKLPLVPPFRETGGFLPADASASTCQAATEATDRALRALGVTEGFVHTELKLTSRGPQVIEVNGRLGGWLHDLYRRHARVDLVRIALLAAAGQRPEVVMRSRQGVAFQFSNLAPADARRLLAGPAPETIRRIKGIVGYSRLFREGDTIPDGTGSNELDLVCADAATYGDMFETSRQVAKAAMFTFADREGGLFSMTGRDLPSWSAVVDR